MTDDSNAPSLTPLEAWADQVGLPYQRAHHLASEGHIEATQLGRRWYVVGDGLPEDEEGDVGDDHDGVGGE